MLVAGFAVMASFPVIGRGQDEITLEVNLVDGGSSIDFGRLRNLGTDGNPVNENAIRRVRLIIKPALGNVKPYIVTQILDTELSNQAGSSVSSGSMTYRVEEESGTGTVRVPEQTPLTAGEQEIYQSNPEGGNAQLLLTYDLTTSQEQQAGSYRGSITYRVSTL